MRPIRVAAKAIVIRDGRLLAIRLRDGEEEWHILPGGGQLPGESLPQALRRECREEMGTDVHVGSLRLVRDYIGAHHEFAEHDGDEHGLELMFECRLEGPREPDLGAVPDTGQVGVSWLPLSELQRFNLYPRILRTTLAGGLPEDGAIYLGDVN